MTYSVVIRTLGTAGEKYQALLDSIDRQTVRPEHVYVFIAEGYELPKERLGYEEFIPTKKGMVFQRAFGMTYASEKSEGGGICWCAMTMSHSNPILSKNFSPLLRNSMPTFWCHAFRCRHVSLRD